MTGAGLFLIFSFIFFVVMLYLATIPDSKTDKDKRGANCPPHKWVRVEAVSLTDGRKYTGLKCDKCSAIPQG